MIRAIRTRDGWRLIEKTALVMALLLLVGGLAAAYWSDQLYKRQKLADVQVQAEVLAASVTAALAFQDDLAARDYVGALGASDDIESAGVYDASGALVAGFQRTPDLAPPATLDDVRPAFFQGDLIIATVPVSEGQTELGAVYLRSLTMSPASRMLRYGLIALMAVMAALVVGVLAFAHGALRRVNADLDQRAHDLADANAALLVEIEERARAEEALRQSQKMEAMGQLTGGVAHDFNNLLMAVTSGLRLLERSQDPERRTAVMSGIQQAVERGARLTRQLLAFARRQTLKPESIDPGARIEGMRELLQRSLREDISVIIDMPQDLWPIEVDPGQLELVIINLAVNARDAMPDGGVLTIQGRNMAAGAGGQDVDMVCIAVRDTGFGMTPEILERAFEPFFTTKDVHKGTGLGLSQVYGFASQSNGSAKIESRPGEGAAVSLILPRSGRVPEPAATPERPAMARPVAPMKVLLVEDDDTVAQMVCALIAELGHHCIHAASAAAALELLTADRQFDLVFSDIVMPGGMNGLELGRTIRDRFPGLPVILTTGYSETAHMVGQEFPILRKPYNPEDLQAAFEEARDNAQRGARSAFSGPRA